MSDDAPPNPRSGLPPVRMALRVIGRHGHRGGPHLARAVEAARAPKHLAASTRLAHPGTGHCRACAGRGLRAGPGAGPTPPWVGRAGLEVAREPASRRCRTGPTSPG